MTQGGYRAGKSSDRSKTANHAITPSILAPVLEQDDTTSILINLSSNQTLLPNSTSLVQMLGERNTPIIFETSVVTPNQSSPTSENMNFQSNTAAEGTSSQRNVSGLADFNFSNGWTLIYLTSSGLEPSSKCFSFITLSFKSEVDLNVINLKGVSKDVKYDYFGEFKKKFNWDASVSEEVVMQQWLKKDTLCYKNFISNIKKHRATVQLEFVNGHV
ncbi:hypothetical protein P3L10_000776 [Capsicum annuum]